MTHALVERNSQTEQVACRAIKTTCRSHVLPAAAQDFLVTGRGSDVMQPMAIPSVGGMAVNLITLFIAPCIYCLVK